MRIALVLSVAAVFSSLSFAGAAQAPADATTPPPPALAAQFQPALSTIQQALGAVNLDRWKRGNIREEASHNIGEIQRDIQTNLPPLVQQADAAPGAISKLLPVSRNIDALYDVLLRVVEAARISAPDNQAAQLQQALVSLGNARLALGDRIQGSAIVMEKQVVDLRGSLQAEVARRQAAPVPVALPCVPPAPVHRAVRRRRPAPKTPAKPAATPAQKKPAPSTTKPSTSN